jgi:hypothetical protein
MKNLQWDGLWPKHDEMLGVCRTAVPEDDSDDEPVISMHRQSRQVRSGAECPYLDTISRQVRDLGLLGSRAIDTTDRIQGLVALPNVYVHLMAN